jgi:isopenicillin N synthase-like dioxygenase
MVRKGRTQVLFMLLSAVINVDILFVQVLKYMLYEPMSPSEAEKTNNVYLTAHNDFNTITTLFSQPVAGLQVLGSDGSWKWVKVSIQREGV